MITLGFKVTSLTVPWFSSKVVGENTLSKNILYLKKREMITYIVIICKFLRVYASALFFFWLAEAYLSTICPSSFGYDIVSIDSKEQRNNYASLVISTLLWMSW